MDTFVGKEQLKAVVREAIISVLEDDVYRSHPSARSRRSFASDTHGQVVYRGLRGRRWQKS